MTAQSRSEPAAPAQGVEIHVGTGVPRSALQEASQRIAALERYVGHPLTGARLTVRKGAARTDQRYVADASVRFHGRTVAAHAVGPSPREAAERVADRLQRQLRRVADSDVAKRERPRALAAALDPETGYRPEVGVIPATERRLVRRRSDADEPLDTLDAVAMLLERDLEFLLFRHTRTSEDVVVHLREDRSIGLIHPPGSELANENELVVPAAAWLSGTVEEARAELDARAERFVYFIDSVDGRAKVLYLRHDGNYGLVEVAA